MHLKELPNIAKRYFGRLLILFTIVALVTAFGSRVVLGPKIPAALVVQRDFIQTIVATGHVETPHRISVGSQIVGVVKNIPVSEGQIVQAGQVLIELDDAEWRAAAQQADMLVLQAQARLRQVREVQAPVAAQSLAVARALAMTPPLVLADEPTGNLDSQSAEAVFTLFRKVNREQGTAILFVTHNAALAERCDKIIQVVDGKLIS